MKLGVATVVTDEGLRPDVLAKALEYRGFDSLVVAEHSHIPASRATPFPAGGALPREYYRSYDPFVALTAAALATSKLLIGPVLLLPQRDTIQTAQAASSLDQISAGRLLLGLGLGWNLEGMPMAVPVADMVAAQLSLLDGATDIPVSVIVAESAELALLDAYLQHGAQRAFILLSTKPESETLQLLDSLAALTETHS